jgi:D-xylose transport system substrate-binding protein
MSTQEVKRRVMFRNTRMAVGVAAAAVLAIGLVAAGCGSSNDNNGGGGTSSSNNKGGTIALLLPETKTARYESQDKPHFEQKVKALCPNCKIIYQNADQDAAQQQPR